MTLWVWVYWRLMQSGLLFLCCLKRKAWLVSEFVLRRMTGWKHAGAQSLQWGGVSRERSVLLPQWLRHWTPVQLPGGRAPVGCHAPRLPTHLFCFLFHTHRVRRCESLPRLLKSMGWQEYPENDDNFLPLTEDELREFQTKTEQVTSGTNLHLFLSGAEGAGLTVGSLCRSWRGTACRGTGPCPGSGASPSTSPPGGVWPRPTWRRAPSRRPVAAARPRTTTTTTASNPNVALWNKKQPTQHPSKNPLPLSSLFLEHRFEFFCFCFLSFLHKGKTNHIQVKGEIPALPDVVFPAFPPSLQSLPSLTLLFLFLLLHLFHLPLSSSLCGTEVFKTRRALNAHLILL